MSVCLLVNTPLSGTQKKIGFGATHHSGSDLDMSLNALRSTIAQLTPWKNKKTIRETQVFTWQSLQNSY